MSDVYLLLGAMKYPKLLSLAVASWFCPWGICLNSLSKSGMKSTQFDSQITKELCKSDVTVPRLNSHTLQVIKHQSMFLCGVQTSRRRQR